YSSHDRVREVFGDRSPTSLDNGLARMADWVRRHGARASQRFEGIEVQKNFPRAWME
ncbi:MAG: UDP-glucose 4-epimerase, partial [Chloroflexales bacterium]|nr:UDP-glucose 4-epimerase [Chloroflexales bacterium]